MSATLLEGYREKSIDKMKYYGRNNVLAREKYSRGGIILLREN